ncbi:MAG TPA: hypothetical protein VKN63_05900 [Afifellaceae bacterium]|nr:hypothetical protein [Afifellaceae bacterium]
MLVSDIMAHVSATKHLTGEHALEMRRAIYKDGRIDPAELDSLFALDESAERRDREWVSLLSEAIVDYLVHQQAPEGYIDEANAKWLVDRIARDGVVKTESELEALIKVLEAAKSSPESLVSFTLEQVKTAVLTGQGAVTQHRKLLVDNPEDGPMTMKLDPNSLGGELTPGRVGAAEVKLLRRILYAFGGDGGVAVSRAEAEVLFDINDATLDADNDPAWVDLFSKALASAIMATSGYSAPSRDVALRQEEWLNSEDGGTADFFGRMLSGGLRGILNAYKDPAEDAWKARNNAMETAIQSAETVDQGEAEWLVSLIRRDGKVSDAEAALLKFIAEESPNIHPSLKPLIEQAA